MKKILLLTTALISSGILSYAQSTGPSTLNSSGGSASIGSNTYEWSIGEMTLVHTASGGSITVTQGILQPLIIEEDTSINIKEPKLTQYQLQLFPNPADNIVYLQPSLQPDSELAVQLFDIHGKLLYKKVHQLEQGNERQTISLAGFASGNYLLSVVASEPDRIYTNSFKITKQ